MKTVFTLANVLSNVKSTSRGAGTAGESIVGKTFHITGSQFPWANGEVDETADPVGVKTDLDVNFGFKTLMMSVDTEGKPLWKTFTEANDINTAKEKEGDNEIDLTNASFVVEAAIPRMRDGNPICTPQSYSEFDNVTNKGKKDLGDLNDAEWNKIYNKPSKLLPNHTPLYTYEINLALPNR